MKRIQRLRATDLQSLCDPPTREGPCCSNGPPRPSVRPPDAPTRSPMGRCPPERGHPGRRPVRAGSRDRYPDAWRGAGGPADAEGAPDLCIGHGGTRNRHAARRDASSAMAGRRIRERPAPGRTITRTDHQARHGCSRHPRRSTVGGQSPCPRPLSPNYGLTGALSRNAGWPLASAGSTTRWYSGKMMDRRARPTP
jgi:hypothetical protein